MLPTQVILMILKLIDGQLHQFRMILQGDFGKDPDDVFALMTSYNNVDVVIANLYPSSMRARLAKSVIRDIGDGDDSIPVYAGSNVCKDILTVHDYEFDYPNLVDEDQIIKDSNPYLTILNDGIPTIIVVNSAMTDLATFLSTSYDKTKHNIHQIIMQGGHYQEDDGYIKPNNSANNVFDFFSAQVCFDLIQEKNIFFVLMTKKIAYANPINKNFFKQLNLDYPNLIPMQYLERVQIQAILELYQLASLPPQDSYRQGLPDDRDLEWFFKFIAKKPMPSKVPPASDILHFIDNFNIYDVFTVLYAIERVPLNTFCLNELNKCCFEATAKSIINYPEYIHQSLVANL